ncbi:unnamed protein product [Rodentolepis nana]|uniref:Pollen Ole e 1 allergen and extensin family protein n=1 Tax=Rodentolepis nana TaxID=102285 RepID=A0A0R3TR93_RODNA|nr:unnamed protein product [Rodentolepis nana]
MRSFKLIRLWLRLLLVLLATQMVVTVRLDNTNEAKVDEDDIPGTDDAFRAYMKNATNTFCTCGISVLQRRFCNNDFAIVARKVGPSTRFVEDPEYVGMKYAGVVIPVAVDQVFRGPMKVNTTVSLRYVMGSFCGVDRNSIPEDGQRFLITGFQYKFLKRKKTTGEPEGMELFLVTSCSDSMKLETLSVTQTAGVFLNHYCGDTSITNPTVYLTQNKPKDTSTCYFHFSQAKCFNNVLAKIPVELREMVKAHNAAGVSDQDLFYNCLFHVNLPPP